MDGCIYRTKYGECTIPNRSMEYGPLCRSDCTDKHPSNADRIRAMTDAELAEHIVECVAADFFRANVLGIKPNSKDDWLDWLKQEATDGT